MAERREYVKNPDASKNYKVVKEFGDNKKEEEKIIPVSTSYYHNRILLRL